MRTGEYRRLDLPRQKVRKAGRDHETGRHRPGDVQDAVRDARKAFAEAWESTTAEREEIQRQLDEIYELLKCRLTPGQKECLDKAAEDVFSDIDECSPDPAAVLGSVSSTTRSATTTSRRSPPDREVSKGHRGQHRMLHVARRRGAGPDRPDSRHQGRSHRSRRRHHRQQRQAKVRGGMPDG